MPERKQTKCPNLIAGKRRLEPKDAAIVSGIPAPKALAQGSWPDGLRGELSQVAKVLEYTLKGASLKTSKGMLKGSVEQRKAKPGSPARANPYDTLTGRRKEWRARTTASRHGPARTLPEPRIKK